MANSARKAIGGPAEPRDRHDEFDRRPSKGVAEHSRNRQNAGQRSDELGDHIEHAVPRRDLAEPREGQCYGGIEMSTGLAPTANR